MKKILVFILIVFFLSSCHQKSKEETAKELIDYQLKNSLDDYKSYEPVKFSKLDSAYASIDDDSSYNNYKLKDDSITSAMKQLSRDLNIYGEVWAMNGELQDKKIEMTNLLQLGKIYLNKMDSVINSFHPKFIGWKMEHTYRAKTVSGNLEIFFYDYYFDSSLTKLIRHTDVTDNTYHKTVIDTLN